MIRPAPAPMATPVPMNRPKRGRCGPRRRTQRGQVRPSWGCPRPRLRTGERRSRHQSTGGARAVPSHGRAEQVQQAAASSARSARSPEAVTRPPATASAHVMSPVTSDKNDVGAESRSRPGACRGGARALDDLRGAEGRHAHLDGLAGRALREFFEAPPHRGGRSRLCRSIGRRPRATRPRRSGPRCYQGCGGVPSCEVLRQGGFPRVAQLVEPHAERTLDLDARLRRRSRRRAPRAPRAPRASPQKRSSSVRGTATSTRPWDSLRTAPARAHAVALARARRAPRARPRRSAARRARPRRRGHPRRPRARRR